MPLPWKSPVSPAQRARGRRMLEELPGAQELVWATATRLTHIPGPKRVLLTGASPRAGTTLIATATAIGLTRHRRVTVGLLETDVARPAMAAYLGLAPVGLSDVLDGRVELADALQAPPAYPGLLVLAGGTRRATRPGELTTERMDAVLAALAHRCRFVLIDAAPLTDHLEARLLLRHADAALLVLRARATTHAGARRAHEILLESGVPVLGSVLNAHRPEGPLGGRAPARTGFERAVRAARVEPQDPVEAPPPAAAPAEVPGSNGRAAADASARLVAGPAGTPSETHAAHLEPGHAHGHEVELLQRRIAKLTLRLAHAEEELTRLSALQAVDPGVPSLYRGVQGLSPLEAAQDAKRALMQDIFRANLELKTAMTRQP